MFDLELDREKNQYETGQRGGNSAEQRQKEADEALQRLSELARRQKELAQQQNQSKQQTFEQRWQQEMLRREAEELRKQMEQLQQQAAQGQQGQRDSNRHHPGSQQGQSGELRTIRPARRPAAEPQSTAPAKSAEPAAIAAGARPPQSGA